MKTISSALDTHLQQDVTTVTTCWKITRTDGEVFAFTELDEDVTYAGIVYKSMGGFNRSAMQSTSTFQIDNMEVNGFLSDDTIPDEELRNGAFDYAEVEVFLLNYMDTSQGIMRLRHGYFGEVRTAPSGAFLVELRGLIQLLSTKIGQIFVPECKVDLGSTKCGVKLFPQVRRSSAQYKKGDRILFPVDLPGAILPANLALTNPSFEDGLTGWDDRILASTGYGNFNLRPIVEDSRFCYSSGLGPSQHDISLVTGDITAELIDAGSVTITLEYWAASYDYKAEGKVTLDFDVGASLVSDPGTPHPPRNFAKYTLTGKVPIGARKVDLFIGTGNDAGGSSTMAFDEFSGVLTVDQAEIGYQQYGGVEFEAMNDGETGSTAPTFDATLDAETEDGTIMWKAVQPRHTFLGKVASDQTVASVIVAESIDKPTGWFDWGVVEFLTGANIGRKCEVRSWKSDTNELALVFAMPRPCKAGDLFRVHTGCDKLVGTCNDKFDNVINFRGEPNVPGNGEYFKVALP